MEGGAVSIYRLGGRAETIRHCGNLMIDPVVSSNLSELRRELKKQVRKYRKEKRSYRLWIVKVHFKKLTQDVLIEALTEDHLDVLIESTEIITECTSAYS